MSEHRFGEVWHDAHDNEVVFVVAAGYYDGSPSKDPNAAMVLVLSASELSGTNSVPGHALGRLLSPDHWSHVDE